MCERGVRELERTVCQRVVHDQIEGDVAQQLRPKLAVRVQHQLKRLAVKARRRRRRGRLLMLFEVELLLLLLLLFGGAGAVGVDDANEVVHRKLLRRHHTQNILARDGVAQRSL